MTLVLYQSISYVLLGLTTISLWFYRAKFIWPICLIISLFFALLAGLITAKAFIPLGVLCLCYIILANDMHGFFHMLAAIIAAGISFGLMWHLFYGFDNLPLTPNQPLSPNAFPITLQIPYDIPFVGIFAIGFYVKLIDKADEWPPLWIKSLLWSILTTAICIILFFSMKLGAMDLKAPLVLFAYIPILFFFIIIPEEAFYRGFLQEAITRKLNNKLAPFLALLVVGLLFAITRIPLAPTLSFFFFSFFQSLFYSGAYYLTGFIEGAIITRSIFTLIHLFLLTYPSFT